MPAFIALSASAVNANIYRINLTFVDQDTPTTGTLTGFIVIDESLFDGTENRTSGNSIAMPNWMTHASLTISPTGGGSDITVNSFDRLDWNVGTGVDFTATTNLLSSQVTRFGLSDFGDFKGSATSAPLIQQYHQGEFLLSAASAPIAAPGPLPLLGLGTFAWYFKKFNKKKELDLKD